MQQKKSRGVQQHEVDAAADALLARQLRPTIERVREELGRGSPNTIAPMLETWFATLAPRLGVRPAEEGVGAAEGGSEARPAVVRRMADELWRSALALAAEQAQQAVAIEKATLEQDREALSTAQAALQAERAQFAQKEEYWQQQLQDGRQRAQLLDERVRNLEIELSAAKTELSQTHARLQESAASRATDFQSFQEQLRSLTADRERIQERAAASERRHLEEVDRARQEAKQLRQQHAEADRKLQERCQALDRERSALHEQLVAAKAEIGGLQERIAAGDRLFHEYRTMLKARAAETPANAKPPRRRLAAAKPKLAGRRIRTG